ncbi:MAG: ABC transporter ATP-binding protein [Sphingomonadales bacterium]
MALSLAGHKFLADVSLVLQPGALVGVIGPNGAGKSSLLKALAGLGATTPLLDGAPLRPAPRTLAFLPATRDLDWPVRADALVQLGLGPLAPADPAAVAAALADAGASGFAARPVNQLSTGERARVLLARALVASPRWLVLDEPVANLDPGHRLDVLALLAARAAAGTGVVLALHDLDLAARCDRLLLLDQGRLLADGPPAGVLADAQLAAVFGVVRGPAGWLRA